VYVWRVRVVVVVVLSWEVSMSDTFRVYLFCAHDCETVTIRCAVMLVFAIVPLGCLSSCYKSSIAALVRLTALPPPPNRSF
jgi:hypothetical protein